MKRTKCFLARMRRSFPVARKHHVRLWRSTVPYSREFRKIRPLILLMYGYNNGENVHIHHIDRDRQDNEKWNLIALPHNEHMKITRRHRNPFTSTLDREVFYSITNAWHE